MKRNFLIVLLLVLIGGGFMYLNTNTEFFKGSLLGNNEIQTEDSLSRKLPFEDNHFIDLYLKSRMKEWTDCQQDNPIKAQDLTHGYGDSECSSILKDINDRKAALESLYNLDYYNQFKAKNIDGKWYACEDGDYADECKTLKELGYDKDFFHELFGLDPYEERSNGMKLIPANSSIYE